MNRNLKDETCFLICKNSFMNINKIKLITIILLPFLMTACSKEQTNQTNQTSESKELYFECDYSSRGESRIDSISVDNVSKTGTYEPGDPEMKKILRYMRGGTILPTKITMTADTLFIKHYNLMTDSLAYTVTKTIDRETLVYADSVVILGKCKILKKEVKF